MTEPATTFEAEASDESIEALADDLSVGEDLHTAGDIVEARAAKAKEGTTAIEQARHMIEEFDGEGEGFIDAAELKAALTLVQDMAQRLDTLEAQVAQLTQALQAK